MLDNSCETMGKILLFYKYVDITYPEQVRKWQERICKKFGLRGRVIVAHEGINGTVGGSLEATELYKAELLSHNLFNDIDVKESEGDSLHFPRLRVVVKREITRLNIDPTQLRAKDGGKHLTPDEVHALLTNKPDNLVILDGRNQYESRIGAFTGAIKPNIEYFSELPGYIDANIEQFKDKQVLMYCTGGIRCERASAYLKSKGVAQEVYQLKGGIHRYLEQYPDGHFRGKNYVFDGRVTIATNEDILTTCDSCGITCDEYTNCMNALCNNQYICCSACLQALKNCCSTQCMELIESGNTVVRKSPKKVESPAPSSCSFL